MPADIDAAAAATPRRRFRHCCALPITPIAIAMMLLMAIAAITLLRRCH